MRGQPIDHLVQIGPALRERLQRNDDERLRVESQHRHQVGVLEALAYCFGGGLRVGQFVFAAHRSRLVYHQHERALALLALGRLHDHGHRFGHGARLPLPESEARIAPDHRERSAAFHVIRQCILRLRRKAILGQIVQEDRIVAADAPVPSS